MCDCWAAALGLARGFAPDCVVRITWLCLLAFGIFITAAAISYPGGTWEDPASIGFSFWHNFWCDLLGTVALNGRPNLRGALLARSAFVCFAVALFRFWPLVVRFAGRSPASVSERLGTFGASALMAAALVPAALSQILHGLAVVLSAACSVAAVVPIIPAVWRRGAASAALLGSAAVALAAVCVLQYVYQGFSGDAAGWLAGMQKITTAFLLAFILQVLTQTRIGASAGASTLRSASEVE